MTMPTPEPLGLVEASEQAGAARLSGFMVCAGIATAVLIANILLESRWLREQRWTIGQFMSLMLRSNRDL